MCWRLLASGRAPASHLLLALVLPLSLLVACKPPEDRAATQGGSSMTVTAELLATPSVGPVPLAVTVTSADGSGVEGATVKVEGNMTHAGMVPVLVDALEVGGGHYRADDMRFTMAGDWLITVTVTAGSERSTGVLPVSVGR